MVWTRAQEDEYQQHCQTRENHARQLAAKREYEQELREQVRRLQLGLAELIGPRAAARLADGDRRCGESAALYARIMLHWEQYGLCRLIRRQDPTLTTATAALIKHHHGQLHIALDYRRRVRQGEREWAARDVPHGD